jgi:hypothetical protein
VRSAGFWSLFHIARSSPISIHRQAAVSRVPACCESTACHLHRSLQPRLHEACGGMDSNRVLIEGVTYLEGPPANDLRCDIRAFSNRRRESSCRSCEQSSSHDSNPEGRPCTIPVARQKRWASIGLYRLSQSTCGDLHGWPVTTSGMVVSLIEQGEPCNA